MAKSLTPAHRRGAKILALYGDLGAGKTTFVQGFLKAFRARGRVTSPTFVLMKKFALPRGKFKRAYHIDAYRFHAPRESAPLGLEEIFQDPRAIVLIEWPERLGKLLPKRAKKIKFAHGKHEGERIIKV